MKIFIILLSLFLSPLLIAQVFDSFNILEYPNHENFDLFNGKTIDYDYLEKIPERNLNRIYTFQNGISKQDTSLHIRGGLGYQTEYYLNGISIKDPLVGNLNLSIPIDALDNVKIYTGGFSPEYGNASSAIFHQLKSGSEEFQSHFKYITDDLEFKNSNSAFDSKKRLGAYWYGYNEINGNISGPIIDSMFTYFLNFNYQFNRDRNPQEWRGINLGKIVDKQSVDSINLFYPAGVIKGNLQNIYSYAATINLNLNPLFIRVTGFLANSNQQINQSPILSFLNPRYGKQDTDTKLFSIHLSHKISSQFSYEFNGGYFSQKIEIYDPYLKEDYWSYGDSLANANAGWVWHRPIKDLLSIKNGRYLTPSPRHIFGFSFSGYGDLPVNYSKTNYHKIDLNGKLSFKINDKNIVTLGGGYQKYTIRHWSVDSQKSLAGLLYINLIANPNASATSLKNSILRLGGVNNYGYDVLGNENDEGFFLKPHKPVFANIFLEDNLKFKSINVSAGLRFDYINYDNFQLKNENLPDLGIAAPGGKVVEDGFIETPSFKSVSPRLGLAMPVLGTLLHLQAGHYVTLPKLKDVYQGIYYKARRIMIGFGADINNEIRPTRTTQYEVGISKIFSKFLSADLTVYYKTIKNIPQLEPVFVDVSSSFSDYQTLKSNGSASINGYELNFSFKNYKGISAIINASLQNTTGSRISYSRIFSSLVGNSSYYFPVDAPLDYENKVRSSLYLNYSFNNNSSSILNGLNLSLLGLYHTGHPFTKINIQNTRVFDGQINSETVPNYFQLDFKIDENIKIYKLSLDFFVWIRNIFDIENVINVFPTTGSAETDGYLENPELSQRLIASYGEKYAAVYKAINIDYQTQFRNGSDIYLYGPPRQIMLGVKLGY